MPDILHDHSPMPGNGKYAGKRMIDIPGAYFLYLYENNLPMTTEVRKYVTDNMDAFRKEAGRKR